MTDLEMTKLCAAAIGLEEYDDSKDEFIDGVPPSGLPVALDQGALVFYYDPLHDDAQAMALEDWLIVRGLVRYFGDRMEFVQFGAMRVWSMNFTNKTERRRAIVECVAQMQLERTKSAQSGGQSEDKQLTKVG